jgi:hypothetical protein
MWFGWGFEQLLPTTGFFNRAPLSKQSMTNKADVDYIKTHFIKVMCLYLCQS